MTWNLDVRDALDRAGVPEQDDNHVFISDQALRVAVLAAERDQLRDEVERLRRLLLTAQPFIGRVSAHAPGIRMDVERTLTEGQ